MNRIEQIWNWLDDNKCEVICEIGTHSGINGARMMKLGGCKKYIGFDVWSEGSQDLDEIENNVKKHYTVDEARANLKGYDVDLIEGNTRITIPEYVKGKEPFIDMVFIDGGHSKHTIQSDFLNISKVVKDSGTIFFDDYYFGCPDANMGAQAVMSTINVPYTVLPKVDKAKGGYLIKIAKVDMIDVPRVPESKLDESSKWVFEL